MVPHMTSTPATLGYTIFYVNDVDAALAFYTTVFGLERRFLTPEADYGELMTGGTTLSFVSLKLAATNLDAAGGFTPVASVTPPVGASITLVTEDVPARLALALENGATRYVDPIDKPWGQTVAYVRDPQGILVEIATPMAS